MSIYCSLWTIQVEDQERGGSYSGAWFECWAQAVPNHINEQNGYAGPIWDEWLPAFVHKPDCQMRTFTYYVVPDPDGSPFARHADESEPGAERRTEQSCDCGNRAVFICDDLTTKATERNGQEYVNPVLVLTGAEYEAITWTDMLGRISEAMHERRVRPLCMEPNCTGEAIHTELRKGEIVAAWCEQHDTAKLWRGQRKRRSAAAEPSGEGAP